jgi:hypothetical protein
MLTKHNDAELPLERRCVVKFRLKDGGVVKRIQLAIDDDLSIEFLAHHSITGVCGDQDVLRRKCVAVFEFPKSHG